MSDFDIAGILNGLYRRKGIIIAVFLVVSLPGELSGNYSTGYVSIEYSYCDYVPSGCLPLL